MFRKSIFFMIASLAVGCVQQSEIDPLPDAGAGVVPDLPVLRIDPVDPTSYHESVSIHGTGPALGILHYTTASGDLQEPIDGDGSFCIDLPLAPESENQFTLRASNPEGVYSQEKTVAVLHRARVDDEGSPGVDEPRNVAEGAADFSASNVIAQGGELRSAVDGDDGSYVMLQHTNAWGSDWYGFKLAERARIDFIQIMGTTECYPTDYRIYLSDQEAPGNPWDSRDGWQMIDEVDDGAQIQNVVPPLAQPLARWFAMRFDSDSCGGFLGYDVHEIREIKVMTRDVDADSEPADPDEGVPLGPQAPTCPRR